jgi:hypothetical protein
MDWIDLAQDKDRWRVLLEAVISEFNKKRGDLAI